MRVLRIVPSVFLSSVLLIVASPLAGTAKLLCWGAAATIDYLGPLVGHMRGWRLSPRHFVERFGQIILIALGESMVAIGVGATGLDLDPALIGTVLLGVTVVACLWWSYFDWVVYIARSRLAEATGARRAALARDVYSYLHLPMVGGIVLFAFGVETALHHTGKSLPVVPAFGLVYGIVLYLLAHVALRLRIRRRTRARATDRRAGAPRVAARCDTRARRGCARHGRRSVRRAHRVRGAAAP